MYEYDLLLERVATDTMWCPTGTPTNLITGFTGTPEACGATCTGTADIAAVLDTNSLMPECACYSACTPTSVGTNAYIIANIPCSA